MECISAGGRFHQDGAIMIVNGLLGIMTGGTLVALATNIFGADAPGALGPGLTAGLLISLGLGLVGLGIRGRKKIFQGTPGQRISGQIEIQTEAYHEIQYEGPGRRRVSQSEGKD